MERRQYKRYSGIPIRVLLKSENGSYKNVEPINISIGGILIRTKDELRIYDNYVLKIEIPIGEITALKNPEKDVIFAKGIVWRLDADKETFSLNNKNNFFYAAIKFINIDEHDKIVISQYLSNFEENVPYE
jgi:hypothetical protein